MTVTTLENDASAILTETRRTLTQLARLQNVNPATTWRWKTKGIRGVKLAALLIGGRWFSSDEAFARFVAATTGTTQPSDVNDCLAESRATQSAAASARLAKAGF